MTRSEQQALEQRTDGFRSTITFAITCTSIFIFTILLPSILHNDTPNIIVITITAIIIIIIIIITIIDLSSVVPLAGQ